MSGFNDWWILSGNANCKVMFEYVLTDNTTASLRELARQAWIAGEASKIQSPRSTTDQELMYKVRSMVKSIMDEQRCLNKIGKGHLVSKEFLPPE